MSEGLFFDSQCNHCVGNASVEPDVACNHNLTKNVTLSPLGLKIVDGSKASTWATYGCQGLKCSLLNLIGSLRENNNSSLGIVSGP